MGGVRALETKLAAGAVAGAACLVTLWLADPRFFARTVVPHADPPGLLLSLGALAQIAALGALAPLSLRVQALCPRSEDLWREGLRGMLLGLAAHGAAALAEGVYFWLAALLA